MVEAQESRQHEIKEKKNEDLIKRHDKKENVERIMRKQAF
jgi:hypothetical protein